jgi:hypothetical protein
VGQFFAWANGSRRERATGAFPLVVVTALVSSGLQVMAVGLGWPLQATLQLVLLPWVALLVWELACAYRDRFWLGLFTTLLVFQGGHFMEHIIQMWQIHVLNLQGPDARGLVSVLDVEWVHFVFNSWVLLASALLLYRFGRSRWLWAMVIFSGWHEIEHAYLLRVFLTTGQAGTPGLLAQGGAILGGLPIPRADLHFLYNLVEVALLAAAFRSLHLPSRVRRARGQWADGLARPA